MKPEIYDMMSIKGGILIDKQLEYFTNKAKDYRILLVVYAIVGGYLYLGGVNDTFIAINPDGPILLLASLLIVVMSGIFGMNIYILEKQIKRMRSK
ncbi:hypothetical protein ACFSMW_14845 [Virgibacillus halophilus]